MRFEGIKPAPIEERRGGNTVTFRQRSVGYALWQRNAATLAGLSGLRPPAADSNAPFLQVKTLFSIAPNEELGHELSQFGHAAGL
ncbi:MAG: hypothetical protein OXM02_07680 [Bacteroidota bacterium]|nr:hypothetical protein [Bacteroidota bacterium]